MIEELTRTGLSYLIIGLACFLVAYLLPGYYRMKDRKEGIELLEIREAARQNSEPRVWLTKILTVVLWPWVDWEKVDTHHHWALYIKHEREITDDDDSDGPPTSSKKNGESGD